MTPFIVQVHIGLLLVCFFNLGFGLLTMTSSAFECGQSALVVCSRTSNTVTSISWIIRDQIRLCPFTFCQFPIQGNYNFTADGGVWTLTIDPVELKDNNITFTCQASSPGTDAPVRVSSTSVVSVPIDNSSTLTKRETATDVLFTAESNCVKPVWNVNITWQCLKADQVNVIDLDCRLTALQTYTSECKDLNQACAGPGTYRMGRGVKLPTYRGNYFKMVKIKAVLTDWTKVIEKISGEVKQEEPPSIKPLMNCSAIGNSDLSINCNLSSGDPLTVKCTWIALRGTISNNCTLRIPRVQRTSSGTYTCRVENSVGTDTKSFYLDIMYPPEIPVLKIVDTDVTDLTANVLKDTVVTIRCSSSAKPHPLSYTWEPAEGSVDSLLEIIDTSSPFTRTYTCTVTNYINQTCGGNGAQGINSSRVNVHVVYPPEEQAVRFNGSHAIDTSGFISVIRGQSFTLACSANSDPASTYRWDKTTHDGGLLSINNIGLDQSHTCTASNELRLYNGSTVVGQSNKTVDIEVLYAPSVHTMIHQRIIEGSNLSQICDTAPGRPTTTFFLWTRQNGHLTEDKRVLTITNVTPEHADNYTCTAWIILNPSYGITSNGKDQKTFSLEILYPPKLKAVRNQSVMEGSSFTQNCELLRPGNPPGMKTCFSLDQDGNDMRIGGYNGSLTIANVSRNDQGSFKCVTNNIMEPTDRETATGTDFKIFYLNVFYKTVISAFTIDDREDSLVVNQNKTDVKFKCTLSSNPLSQISLRSTTISGSRILKEELSSDHLLYSLPTATCWDSGIYTCSGRNNVTERQVSKAVILLVECTARPLHKVEPIIMIYRGVGEDVTLNLTVVAYPLPGSELFQWYKLEKEHNINPLNGSTVNLSDTSLESKLSLTDIQDADFGLYKLTIKYNDILTAYVQIFSIQPKAESDTRSPNNGAIIGGAVGGGTAVIGVVIVVVVFLRRKAEAKPRRSTDSQRRKANERDIDDLTTGTREHNVPNEYYNISSNTCSSSGPYEDLNQWSGPNHEYSTMDRIDDDKTTTPLPTPKTYENMQLTPLR